VVGLCSLMGERALGRLRRQRRQVPASPLVERLDCLRRRRLGCPRCVVGERTVARYRRAHEHSCGCMPRRRAPRGCCRRVRRRHAHRSLGLLDLLSPCSHGHLRRYAGREVNQPYSSALDQQYSMTNGGEFLPARVQEFAETTGVIWKSNSLHARPTDLNARGRGLGRHDAEAGSYHSAARVK
jgi:hypothetical protein